MARTPKGNNAFALANGNRLAADLTHGVTCSFEGGCRVFDANINKKHEAHWRCEHHGGTKHGRANARDEEYANGIPGSERRMRFARVRNKQRKAAAITAHIPTFLDERAPKPVKKVTPKKAMVETKSAKELKREAAMAILGLTEADIIKFTESN